MVSGDGGSPSHAPPGVVPFNAAFVLLLGLLTANGTIGSGCDINMSETKIMKVDMKSKNVVTVEGKPLTVSQSISREQNQQDRKEAQKKTLKLE